jgi:cellulase/cellobiase CelA1
MGRVLRQNTYVFRRYSKRFLKVIGDLFNLCRSITIRVVNVLFPNGLSEVKVSGTAGCPMKEILQIALVMGDHKEDLEVN